MLILGSIMAVAGLSLLWFSPYTGVLTLLIGLGIVWSSEDQKIKQKNEKKLYDEYNEHEFTRLSFEDPLSPKLFELSTLLYGTVKPHEAWLLEQLNNLETMYSTEAIATIDETQDFTKGKFKNLFGSAEKYKKICVFLSCEVSTEIYDDIQQRSNLPEPPEKKDIKQSELNPNLDEILADYDLEEWAKILIKNELDAKNDRNTIINNVIFQAQKELNKTISVSCLHNEWILNGRIKFKI